MSISLTLSCAKAEGRRRSFGFTLVEVMAAIVVLTLLTAILGQLLGTMSRTWQDGQRRVNNFTKARSMLELIGRDLQMGVFRSDLAAFPNGQIAFYVLRPGIPANSAEDVRTVSLVQYAVETGSSDSVLQRQDFAIDWAASATAISFGNSATLPRLSGAVARDTASGVVGFKIFFVKTDGTLTATYSSSVQAASVALAVIDDKTLMQMSQSQVSALRTALNAKADGSRNTMALWNDYLKSGIDWSAYPKNLAVGLKLFERYVSFADF